MADEHFAAGPEAQAGAKRQLQARAQHDTYDRLHQITAPTLVIGGKNDGLAPLAAQQAMAAQIPEAWFEIVDGSHSMLWESDVVFQHITQFMLSA